MSKLKPCLRCGSINTFTNTAGLSCNDCGYPAGAFHWVVPPDFLEMEKKNARIAALEAQLAEAKNIIDELVFAMSTWRPIETAPKDGTKLLLFGCYSSPVVFIGFWETMTKAPDRWRDTRFNGGVPRKPSHWMPLPEPPTSKTECEK